MTLRLLLAACTLALAAAPGLATAQGSAAPGAAAAARDPDRVVYHINDTSTQALAGLRNIRNHLDTDPTAQVTVVTHAFGVDFLMEGMRDRNENSFATTVAALKNRGVRFQVCEITLQNRNLKKEQFIMEAEFVPSGVVQLTKLQRQGFAYIKP
jgi:intracellular sulfur oxidation DsrE/DsrF family protein